MIFQRNAKHFKVLLFRIEGKRFAVDISEVKKIIKEKKGNIEITELEGAPPYIIGISEIEITQNQKDLITFIDFKKLIDIQKIENQKNLEEGEGKNEKVEEEKVEEEEKKKEKKSESKITKAGKTQNENIEDSERTQNKEETKSKRRVFMILYNSEKENEKREIEKNSPKYLGILIDEIERIEEVREGDNAKIYLPPDIKGVRDFFREIVVFLDDKGEEKYTEINQKSAKRVFILNTKKLFEFIK